MAKTANIIEELQNSLGFVPDIIKKEISLRATPIQSMSVDIASWSQEPHNMPQWAQQLAACWVVEMWMAARDDCEPDQLLLIDKKYTHVLRSYSMGDIIELRNAISKRQVG